MLKLVFRAIGGLGGGASVIWFSFVGGPQGEGAAYAGQMVALLFGLLLFGASMYVIIDTVKHQRQAEPERKPARPVDDDDERTQRKRRSHSIDDDDLYGRSSKVR